MKRIFAAACWVGILACFSLAGTAAAAAELARAVDLAQDAQQAGTEKKALLILFDGPNCAYCQRVKREYLLPMLRNEDVRGKVIMRHLAIGSSRKIIGFDGKPVSPRAFARAHQVKVVPTVLMFDAAGQPAAPALVGLTPDFYGNYLDQIIDQAVQKVRGS